MDAPAEDARGTLNAARLIIIKMLSLEQTEALMLLIKGAPSPETITTAMQTIQKVVANASDPAKGVLKLSNAGMQKRLLGLDGSQAALVALGFVADMAAGTLTWDATLDAAAPTERAADVEAALQAFEAVVSAVIVIGDSNAPAAAQDALKLCATYVGNIAIEPDAPAKRRIGAANKALNGRLFSAKGGAALLAASGFAPDPAQGEPEAYVCERETPLVRLTLCALEKAPSIWAGLAANSSGDGGNADGDSSSGSKGPNFRSGAEEAPSAALTNIVIKSLPNRSAVVSKPCAVDMQPALCKSDDGLRVELFAYQSASKRWSLQGAMEIPGGEFEWAKGNGCVIDVDLGDAHGTGQAVEMLVPVEARTVNEYVAARDFISAHEADSYAKHTEPVLNMNWLEEIARKVRTVTTPLLETVSNLAAAMEAQH